MGTGRMSGGGEGGGVGGDGQGAAMTEELSARTKNAYRMSIVEILRVNEECVSSRIEYNLHGLTRRDRRSKNTRKETGSRFGDEESNNLCHLLPSACSKVIRVSMAYLYNFSFFSYQLCMILAPNRSLV